MKEGEHLEALSVYRILVLERNSKQHWWKAIMNLAGWDRQQRRHLVNRQRTCRFP